MDDPDVTNYGARTPLLRRGRNGKTSKSTHQMVARGRSDQIGGRGGVEGADQIRPEGGTGWEG